MSTASPFTLTDDDVGNPFADTPTSQPYQTPSYIPSSTTTYPTSTNAENLTAREEELRRREAELNEREATLRREQEQMRQAGFHPPNWPKFYPLFYHDIDVEIPEANRKTVLQIYRLWLATMVLLIWNMISCLMLLVSHPRNMNNVASDFGVSLVYVFVIGGASLYLWYRPIYIAFQRNTALYFYIFLLFNGLHVAFAFYMAVGIPGSGSGGFINLLGVLTDGKIVATVFCVVAFAGWILDGLYSLWMWKAVHGYNRSAGHTLESARNEAVTYGVRSGAAQTAASAYVRSESGNFTV
ncbi:uncharacterized protein SPPG_02092 [Spizellomyces punctatus DAOM BR117]|uniref:Scamp-domain-containing protein n=1 Tax=Spizellomyces punctatus (strain DAOM BR117) TaxID=645134 RepID=A0A0L0HNL3_SPIPD|nr:uncharacterized protein SPPG_02092 [Spizellomyces punctatus DAOM BR117]KND03021.1 hypothetical protein SPPG_02092 [Spizellomyces punctatus DAOM BR117]|eukprot:XP_016611060.1 hypothetical protein SPPG_02092 [Spizellomyces punctatus DAOM BR117]